MYISATFFIYDVSTSPFHSITEARCQNELGKKSTSSSGSTILSISEKGFT